MVQVRANPAEMYEKVFVPTLFGPWADVLLDRAQPRSGERVLDVACGTGVVARRAAPMVGASGQVVGLDFSPDMLEVARARAGDEGLAIDWREASAVDLPFPDGAFDLLICQQGLQFFPDRPRAVREMRRVLTTGGRTVIATWQGIDRHPLYRALDDAIERHLVSSPAVPFSFGDPIALRDLLRGAGFGQVEIEETSRVARFPDPDRFVTLTIRAAAAVMPELRQLSETEQADRFAAIERDIADVVAAHVDGDAVAVRWHANVALARA
jgi:SAM-dependent methyltransferase